MQNIFGLTLQELEETLITWGYKKFHAPQIFAWLYQKRIKDFSDMSDLPLVLRDKLKANFSLYELKLTKVVKSCDATEKSLFKLKDNNYIESVLIPAEARITGCVSTQVGCKFKCHFCASGLLGFKRNLTSTEMVEEILGFKKITHIVFMGIGEPLDNYDNVLGTVRIINSRCGLNIGARRITISTCGIIPGIKRLANEGLQIELSISLHAGEDKTRSKIMPINKVYPLRELISACKDYIEKTSRQITFEYVLIKGINSDLPNAKNLCTILKGLKLAKVNVIAANPVRNTKAIGGEDKISNGANSVKELDIEPPNKLEILLFRDYLLKQGINVTLRKPRGQDIEAACGQLRLRYEKK